MQLGVAHANGFALARGNSVSHKKIHVSKEFGIMAIFGEEYEMSLSELVDSNSHAGCYRIDAETGVIRFASRNIADRLGIPFPIPAGWSILQHYCEPRMRVFLVDRIQREKHLLNYPINLKDTAGALFSALITSFYEDKTREIVGMMIFDTLLARKVIDMDLDKHLVESVARKHSDPIFVKDSGGVFVFANNSFADFYDSRPHLIEGSHERDLTADADLLEKYMKQDAEILQDPPGKPRIYGVSEVTDRSAFTRHVATRKMKIDLNTQEGPKSMVFGMVQDVTLSAGLCKLVSNFDGKDRLNIREMAQCCCDLLRNTLRVDYVEVLSKYRGEPLRYDRTGHAGTGLQKSGTVVCESCDDFLPCVESLCEPCEVGDIKGYPPFRGYRWLAIQGFQTGITACCYSDATEFTERQDHALILVLSKDPRREFHAEEIFFVKMVAIFLREVHKEVNETGDRKQRQEERVRLRENEALGQYLKNIEEALELLETSQSNHSSGLGSLFEKHRELLKAGTSIQSNIASLQETLKRMEALRKDLRKQVHILREVQAD